MSAWPALSFINSYTKPYVFKFIDIKFIKFSNLYQNYFLNNFLKVYKSTDDFGQMSWHVFNTRTQEAKARRSLRIWGQYGIHREFEASQGHIVRPCLKKKYRFWIKNCSCLHKIESNQKSNLKLPTYTKFLAFLKNLYVVFIHSTSFK